MKRTKWIELNFYKTREAIESGSLKTMFVRTVNQLADALAKALHPAPFRDLISKMGMNNIFIPPS